MAIVYYTCLNNDCPKHRNIFPEGDPEHQNCARERLWLEGQRPSMPAWIWFALPAALLLGAGAVMLMRSKRNGSDTRPTKLHEERPTQTWSGTERHIDERPGHPVPPPIV